MTIKYFKIDDILPYENNPRHNEGAIEAVAQSIKEFGFKNPIIVDKEMVIVAGHTRLKAARRLGLDKVPVIVADDLTPEQVKAFRLADNKTAELAEWDFLKLEEELANIEMDMTQFDFNMKELQKEFNKNHEVEEDDFDVDEAVEDIKEPTVKRGQVWKLGNHYLMCGNATSEEDINELMNGEKADIVFTDPPYGVSASGGRSQTKEKLNMKSIINDELRKDDLISFLSDFIKVLPIKNNASIYICYSWATQKEFTTAILNNELKIKNCIIWNKKVFGLNGFKGYRPQYEMIYFCCKNDFEWYGDKSQSNV